MEGEDIARVRAIVAELRAEELVAALHRAVSGAPHWRLEAQNLLALVEFGVPPARLTDQFREQLAHQLQRHKEHA
jgi:hypothetical protein